MTAHVSEVTRGGTAYLFPAFQISATIDGSVLFHQDALSRAIQRRAGLVFTGPRDAWS